MALTYFAAALEDAHPGLMDRVVQMAEAENLHTEIRRLGSDVPNAKRAVTTHRSVEIVRRMRFVIAALNMGERGRVKRKRER